MFRTMGCRAPLDSAALNSAALGSIVVVMSLLFAAPHAPQLAVSLNGIVLAQRMTFPVVRHQDAPQIGMAFELNPKEIEILALVPVRAGPHGYHRVHYGIVARELDLKPNAVFALQRNKVVIDFEARFERELVHRRDIREERKPQRRLHGEVFGRPQQVLPRNDDRGFAPEFNHFSDGPSVPFPEFMHYRILIEFLRFHYELIPEGRRLAIPVERALLPEEYVACQQNYNVEHHLHKTKQLQVVVDQRPGIEKDRLDIEQDKHQSDHVELNGDRLARIAGRTDTALVGLIFLPRALVPADHSGQHDQRAGETAGQYKHKQKARVIVEVAALHVRDVAIITARERIGQMNSQRLVCGAVLCGAAKRG